MQFFFRSKTKTETRKEKERELAILAEQKEVLSAVVEEAPFVVAEAGAGAFETKAVPGEKRSVVGEEVGEALELR